MIEQLKQCNASKHKIVEIYKVDIDELAEQAVLWCSECGCVAVYELIDGRYRCKVVDLRIPTVTIEYWNEKYDSNNAATEPDKT